MITRTQPHDYERQPTDRVSVRYQHFITFSTREQWETFNVWHDLLGLVAALDVAEGVTPAPTLEEIAAQDCQCREDWPIACRACLAQARINAQKEE